MILIPFRGTGILIPFYLGLCLWMVGWFFPERTFHDPSFTAWVFLSGTIMCGFHAITILIAHKRTCHGEQRRSIWHPTFIFIPVLFWPFIFLALTA